MTDGPTPLEHRLRRLERLVDDLHARLERLERTPADAPDIGQTRPEPGPPERQAGTPLVSLIGRTIIVLGGAFSLRALTDAGALPRDAGIAAGYLYAAAWFAAADRAARRGRAASGLFHGLAALVIGLPLIWEAATRFAAIGPATAAVLLGILTSAGLFVAWHRRLPSLAGVATLGAIATALALGFATGRLLPFAVWLVIMGIGTARLAEAMGRPWLRWPPAAAADLAVFGLTARALHDPPLEPWLPVILTQGALLAGYLAVFVPRTLVRREPAGAFEFLQALTATALGLGGAAAVGAPHSATILALGGVALVAAAGAYAAAYAVVVPVQGRGVNLVFHATLGIVLALAGSALLFDRAALTLLLSAASAMAGGLAARAGAPLLLLHAALAAAAAAVASPLPGLIRTLWLGGVTAWPAWPFSIALPAASAGLVLAWYLPRIAGGWVGAIRAARVVAGSVLALAAASAGLLAAGPLLAGFPPEAGRLAMARSVVLAGVASAFALAARWRRIRDLSWMAYGVLAVGAVKLVAEDLRVSTSSMLFVVLTVYGLALVVASRSAGRPPDR